MDQRSKTGLKGQSLPMALTIAILFEFVALHTNLFCLALSSAACGQCDALPSSGIIPH